MFDLIDHYNSGPKSELVYEMNMTTWSPYKKNIAYQIKVPNLKKGDLLVCHGNAEATSEHPYNVMICSYIVLVKNKYDIEGLIISPAYGGNITHNEHHRPLFSGGSVKVDSDDYKYVNFVVYTASTAANPEDIVRLEQDYGRLYILRYRERRSKEN